jgi:hypothetical protein
MVMETYSKLIEVYSSFGFVIKMDFALLCWMTAFKEISRILLASLVLAVRAYCCLYKPLEMSL